MERWQPEPFRRPRKYLKYKVQPSITTINMSHFSLSYVSSLLPLLLLSACTTLTQTGHSGPSTDAPQATGSLGLPTSGQVFKMVDGGSSSTEAATSFGLAMNDAINQMDNYTSFNGRWAQHREQNANLPSYFSYGLYCRFFGKPLPVLGADQTRHRSYLKRALKVFERRVLWRAGRLDSLASVNELSDLTSAELDSLKHGGRWRSFATTEGGAAKTASSQPGSSGGLAAIDCCSLDQVYRHIIGLLKGTLTAGASELDNQLTRALLDELEQKSLFEDIDNGPVAVATSASTDNLTSAKRERPQTSLPDVGSPLQTLGLSSSSPTDIGGTQSSSSADGLRRSASEAQKLLKEQQEALSREMAEEYSRQMVEQMTGENSSLARELRNKFSAYFGRPVRIEARRVSTVDAGASQHQASGQSNPQGLSGSTKTTTKPSSSQ